MSYIEGIDQEKLLQMYRFMLLTRRFEEVITDLYHQGRFSETPHSSVGQEAVGVGATLALRQKDLVLPSLRTRAAFFVKGVSVKKHLAEMYGRDTGPSKGRGTSHHMGDPAAGVILGSGVVASSLPVAVGAALGEKLKHSGNVVMAFFGDGASSRGDFHESINLAAVMDLPIVMVCENNLYALSTYFTRQTKVKDIAARAAGYGIPGVVVDGQDVVSVYKAASEAVARAREGQGPTLIECKTYRWRGHSEHHTPDDGRPEDELAAWRSKCPIAKLKAKLTELALLDEATIARLEDEIEKEIREGVEYAENSPYPSPEIIMKNVYASSDVDVSEREQAS